MLIDEALNRFLVQLQADGRSVHTLAQYRRHVGLLARWLRREGHSGAIGKIGHEDLARFLVAPEARQRPDGKAKKATSGNVLRSSLRAFFGYLHKAGYVRQDPSRLIRRARCGASPPRGLSAEERQKLLAALAGANSDAGIRDRALFGLMLAAGPRIGSVLALEVGDVDLAAGELWLRRTKGDQPERVYLSAGICRQLSACIGTRRQGPLFPAHHGGHLGARGVRIRFAAWCRRAGIERRVSPHGLRHAFAMTLYERTGDLLLVKEALRHRSIASTVIYARCAPDRLRQAIAG
ncbi:MAG: hypothetical protein EYC70_07090 [Planctomycetota bacterium]|nr:MAG: hypothetical protein EYC70_07090 [Planctomycetota bacterium]